MNMFDRILLTVKLIAQFLNQRRLIEVSQSSSSSLSIKLIKSIAKPLVQPTRT